VSSSVKKTYMSLGTGSSDLEQRRAGELLYALENSATYTDLVWQNLTAPPPAAAAPAPAAATPANKPPAAKVTGADAELEEIVILGKKTCYRVQLL
jgi:ribosomal protein L12E/L44/L45/RPP1/RPP2